MAFLLLITQVIYKFLGWRVDRRFDEWFSLLSDSLGSAFQKHPQVATPLIYYRLSCWRIIAQPVRKFSIWVLSGSLCRSYYLFY